MNPVVPFGIFSSSNVFPSGIIFCINSSLYPLHESNKRTALSDILGKRTFISHVLKSSLFNFSDVDAPIKIFGALNTVCCTRGLNCPFASFNIINKGEGNLPSADIVGYIV